MFGQLVKTAGLFVLGQDMIELAQIDLEADGACDHSVGICYCGAWESLRLAEEHYANGEPLEAIKGLLEQIEAVGECLSPCDGTDHAELAAHAKAAINA